MRGPRSAWPRPSRPPRRRRWRSPRRCSAAAFICALAAVTALAVGVVIGLAKFIGPLAAGFIGMLIFAAIAGGLGWYGAERLRREL